MSNPISFVTLYDKGYLSRGIALYRSLERECSRDFKLFVLAMDKYVLEYWKVHFDNKLVVIGIDELCEKYRELNDLKKERSRAEFCWTCSAYVIQYVIKRYQLPICIYIDADILFFNDPGRLLEQMGERSVLITEHNYTSEFDQTSISGKFCVQFMAFKNDHAGNEVLEWWRLKCKNACTIDAERGLCGDQKYLDDWESRFADAVFNCRDIGCGVAPWNLQKYSLEMVGGKLIVIDKISRIKRELVFFHFHQLRRLTKDEWFLCEYPVYEDFIEWIYKDYIRRLVKIEKELEFYPDGTYLKGIDKYMVAPVPLFEMPSGDLADVIDSHTEGMVRFTNKNGEELSSVCYELIQENGKWIRIDNIEGVDWFTANFHYAIWMIQKKIQFADEDNYASIMGTVVSRIIKKERVMTEIVSDKLSGYDVEHPFIKKKRVFCLIDELSGNTEIYDSNRIIRVI